MINIKSNKHQNYSLNKINKMILTLHLVISQTIDLLNIIIYY